MQLEELHGALHACVTCTWATIATQCALSLVVSKETLQCADDTVSSELKKEIQSARLAKKLTQAQLANLINEKPQVIQEYESGKVRCLCWMLMVLTACVCYTH